MSELGLRVEGHRYVPQEDFCYELQDSSAACSAPVGKLRCLRLFE